MVIGNPDTVAAAAGGVAGSANSLAHPSGIPQDQIDNIMSGIANTGDVKMNNHRKKLRQRFDIIKKLGQGTYGKVQLGINKETGQEVAIKTIKKCKIEAEADLVRIRREVQIMSSVQHPNIIHIYEVFENREKMVLVMEFAAGGELYDYLSERKVLCEEEARRIFRQVATAVYYCHKHKICHRDLKLENILLDEHGNAKIADFGLSNVFDDQRLLATFCGSPLYASPEIVEGTPYQGPEVDCWSLGVLLYTLVYGSMPFDGSNFKRLVKQISQGDYYEPKKPSRASSLIRDMLTVCPRKRATIEQICSHWWVNENDNVSCLDLAEDLANQTPVRLDVLLSLTPTAITADQLVVPSAGGEGASAAAGKGNERVPRSHSVGSMRDIPPVNTEAERRILDMVAAGGEAALMPSPTRTITPAQSPVQTKRKLEPTVSTENAMGTTAKKKEKPTNSSFVISETTAPLTEETPMDTEAAIVEEPPQTPATTTASFSQKDMELVGGLCEQLIQDNNGTPTAADITPPMTPSNQVQRQKTAGKLDAVAETPEEKDATKVIKKFVNKHKTADLVNAITQATPTAANNEQQSQAANKSGPPPFVRKCSLQDEAPLNKFNAERRKSRILETAEKFQQMNAERAAAANAVNNTNSAASEKPKKFVIPGVSVGSFKKEYERKASTTAAPTQGPTAGERRALEQVAAAAAAAQELETISTPPPSPGVPLANAHSAAALEASDSKNSVSSISLEDARRSMENSIALLRQAQHESSQEVDQLCAQTENIGVSDSPLAPEAVVAAERERKLKNARAIIGNAIQPVIRRPTPLYGIGNGSVGAGVGAGGVGGSGGGFMQMCAVSGSYIDNDGEDKLMPLLSYSAPPMPAAKSPPLLLTPSSHVAALAAAKRTLQERLFGGGVPSIQAQLLSPMQQQQQSRKQWQMQYNDNNNNNSNNNNNNNNNMFYATTSPISASFSASPFKMLQAQMQQKRNEAVNQYQTSQFQQQQPQQQPQNYRASASSMCSPIKSSSSSMNANTQSFIPVLGAVANNANASNTAAVFPYNNNNNQAKTMYAINNINTTMPTSTPMPMPPSTNTNKPNIVANSNNRARPTLYHIAQSSLPAAMWLKSSPGGEPTTPAVKTSTASITLKSATLPRRKANAKTEIQLDIKPRIVEQPAMRFTTEMQHPVADLRSAPPRDGPIPYSPIKTTLNARATSLEPKEHIIPIQRPPQAYTRTTSNTTNTTRSGSLSRQSTIDSESDTTTTATNVSQSTINASSQPIKKSPREFIIPIAVEGGGFITPREGSIEPSESSHTTASSRTTFSRLRPTRRIGSSLLSDAGASIEENSPFQKMRNASITRDGDDDARFTLHRLRSSRPVKKLSQDNDSQSSGEEDDDDGFEILTAENLFSTLLQRVRALTNRLNVNNDLNTGFPNSSRLLSSMRQTQSPFWNQQSPFGSRLNSNVGSNAGSGLGAPWRHSMSRDLGSDMESMFSRTGATLPRGGNNASKSTKRHSSNPADLIATTSVGNNDSNNADQVDTAANVASSSAVDAEPLDLADLDLSRLRLSKKDLETLSSITPGLPKCFQEQLLAKLPPTQARKLSRTLSMQNGTPANASTYKIYKRSQSGGRGFIPELPTAATEEPKQLPSPPLTDTPTTTAASTAIYRRSLSRTRHETSESGIPTPAETSTSGVISYNTVKSRSSSVCPDDNGKPSSSSSTLCGTYTSDINDKYKYYSPYLNKSVKPETDMTGAAAVAANSPQKRYSAGLGRPPIGCLSPPPPVVSAEAGSSSLRRRSSQRRISRFLRPDFFDEPPATATAPATANQEQSSYTRRVRERETQSVLREIREKSMNRSSDAGSESVDMLRRKHSLPNAEPTEQLSEKATSHGRHVRNKSMEVFTDAPEQCRSTTTEATTKNKRRSLSRPRDLDMETLDKHELADKILQELQLLSAVRTQTEQRDILGIEPTNTEPKTDITYSEQTSTIKKVKKLKPKDKSLDVGAEVDGGTTKPTTTSTTTSVVKKVKKVVKRSESTMKTPITEVAPNLSAPAASNETSELLPKKETKIKRPKSYPMKELATAIKSSEVSAVSALPTKLPSKATPTIPEAHEVPNINANVRESRLMRPKSYPATKLTSPKDPKKITRSGAAIPSIAESISAKSNSISRQSTSEEKSLSATPTADNSSSSDSRPTTIKKIIKVTKKSKLVPPTPLTPTTPPTTTTTTTTTSPAESSKESSPVITANKTKEKSPEKKSGKGLLYAIGQKFEKLRDSAMSKEKKAATMAVASSTERTNKKPSPDNSSPEKIKEKTTLLKKKKSNGAALQQEANNKLVSPSTPAEPKSEKRSRIDSMIRHLRERSVPRSQHVSESNYIKRAVSVEDLPGTFNKNTVNKVLGLFKRFDKNDGGEGRVRSTRSTSNIERQLRETTPSPIYENAVAIASAAKAQAKVGSSNSSSGPTKADEDNCNCETVCPECIQNQAGQTLSKRREESQIKSGTAEVLHFKEPTSQSNKEKRKGLMLDLGKVERLDNNTNSSSATNGTYRGAKTTSTLLNGNGLYSNLPPYPGAVKSSSNNSSSQQSMDNVTNNNSTTTTNNNSSSLQTSQTSGYRTASAHEINRNNLLTPSFENIANYSSDSRSYQDDCASTSTFLSPTDEPELYFDNWSICSEDNYMLHATPSPTVSRLSHASQLSSPTRCSESSDPNESVIDRIKRRSFYCRFNEKKPKRTSSIVGPSAVRDYYREQHAATRSSTKSSKAEDRAHSPDITQQFFRPLKLSPVGTELKPPVYRSSLDYSTSASGKPRKSLNDIRTTASPSTTSYLTKRYGSSHMDNDYTNSVPMRYKSSSSSSPYESNGATGASGGYYNTYNPKRRSSYTLNGTLSSGTGSAAPATNIDGYATVGRRSIRPYDHRTMSLLEPPTSSSTGGGSSYHRRENRTPVRDYTSSSNISRSNSRYRTSSVTRSPTNI